MATIPYNSMTRTWPTVGERPASLFQQGLLFLLGLSMPLISLSREWSPSMDIADRVKVVDVVCLVSVAVLLLAGRLRMHWTLITYLLALALAAAIGYAAAPQLSSLRGVFALGMAAMYCVVGLSIGRSPPLVRALLVGLACGVFGEAIVVLHDYFLSPWFKDRSSNRVRGTFSASGQLAQYGFMMAGVMFTFGWACFRSWKGRAMMLSAGMLASLFVLTASRRSGMFSLIIWLSIFLFLGLALKFNRSYRRVALFALIAGICLYAYSAAVSTSYLGTRFIAGLESAQSGQSFFYRQFQRTMDNMDQWFPFGVGIGQGYRVVMPESEWLVAEIHNGHLALVAEMGLLGLLAFYAMLARPILRRWNGSFGPHTKTVRIAMFSFLIAAAAFMLHNRLHRDRTTMLLLGIAPVVAGAAAGFNPGRGMPPGVVMVRRARTQS